MDGLERYDPSMEGAIAYEHWHRYALAQSLAGGRRVLDLGCGEGYGSVLLSNAADEVVGIDLSEGVIGDARRRYEHQARLSFEQADCTHLPFPDGGFDLVVALGLLHEVPEPERCVREAKRVLRAGGVFLASMPAGPAGGQGGAPAALADIGHLLESHFGHVRVLAQRMTVGSTIGPTDGGSDDREAACHAAYALSANPPGAWRLRAGFPTIANAMDYLFVCSDTPVAMAGFETSFFANEDDDIWTKQAAVLRWASGLHEEDEALRIHVRDIERSEAEARSALADASEGHEQRATEIGRLTAETKALAGEVATLRAITAAAPGVREDRLLEGSRSDLRDAIARADGESGHLAAQLDLLRGDREHLLARLGALGAEVKTLTTGMAALRADTRARDAAGETAMRRERDDHQMRLAEAAGVHAAAIADLRESFEAGIRQGEERHRLAMARLRADYDALLDERFPLDPPA